MPSEIGRAEKEKYCIIPPTDGILKIQKKKKKKKLVNITKKKQTHRYREQIGGYQRGEE